MSVPLRGIIAGLALIAVLGAGALLLAQVTGIGRSPTATGVVIAVDSTSAVDVTGFTLRSADGAMTHFRVGELESGGAAFPAVHLRAHLVSLIPIVVSYHLDAGQPIATRMADAPLPGASR